MAFTNLVNNILFLDIETVSQKEIFENLDEDWQRLWTEKTQRLFPENSPEEVYRNAAIYAEFGKVICISFGFIETKNEVSRLKLCSYYGKDEVKLLEGFSMLLQNHFQKSEWRLCAHNGKEFDFPYLCRRMLIHNITLPKILQT